VFHAFLHSQKKIHAEVVSELLVLSTAHTETCTKVLTSQKYRKNEENIHHRYFVMRDQ